MFAGIPEYGMRALCTSRGFGTYCSLLSSFDATLHRLHFVGVRSDDGIVAGVAPVSVSNGRVGV